MAWFAIAKNAIGFVVLLTIGVVSMNLLTAAQPSPSLPAISADLGSCSVLFTVRDGSGKPVSGATLSVRIAYGFMGVRKLDLETSTNTEGKARFDGLPNNLKKALFFRASKEKLTGTAFHDASRNCTAEHTIVMAPRKDVDQEPSPSTEPSEN